MPSTPVIDVWYGPSQSVGFPGLAQRWYNVLGKVQGPNPITSLSYTLNGGSARGLAMGPNFRRLVNLGDYNADIAMTDLAVGANTVVITAVDSAGLVATSNVTVNNHWSHTLPLGSGWWDSQWAYRLPVVIGADGTTRLDHSAEVDVDFTSALTGSGPSGEFDPDSIRVVESAADGTILDPAVPFQFDPALGYDPTSNAAGAVTLLMSGETAAVAERHYDIYFDDVAAAHDPAGFADLVAVTDGVADAGETTIRVATDDATYFYDKDGGGFTSIVDSDGNDWINYNGAPGAAGQYRGIPNLVFPEGVMHPGATGVTSTILSDGPLKTTIRSTTAGDAWATRWDIFADRARMTVEGADHSYWFLYEGTPGGQLDPQTDVVVRSNGTQTTAGTAWDGDLPGEEWAFFGDPTVNRSLFVANHQQDAAVDSYYAMDGEMTVFGFGRSGVGTYMTDQPADFTIGLVDGVDSGGVSPSINAAMRPTAVSVSPAETAEESGQGSGVWPLPTTIDWAGASRVTDRAVVVDGKWSIEGGNIRTAEPGYDRLVAVGDSQWTDYEVSVPVTVHSVDLDNPWQSGPPLVGFVLRWNGHNDTVDPWSQPKLHQGFLPDGVNPTPLGAMAMVRWTSSTSTPVELWNHRTATAAGYGGLQLQLGTTYTFKTRVKTLANGQTEYSFKVWANGTAEPSSWMVEFTAGTGDFEPASGSPVLVAHEADVSFGAVTIEPASP